MPAKVLIVKLSSLGDVLHTLPAAQALRAAMPDAHLAWAIEKSHAPLVRGQPWLDETIEWDRNGVGSFATFIRRLRQTSWDIAIDFQNLLRSALVTRLSGAKRRVGEAPARELAHLAYNDPVRVDGPFRQHAVERSMVIAAHLGATLPGVPIARPYLNASLVQLAGPAVEPAMPLFPLYPTTADREAAEAWCREQGFDESRERLVLLNAHCRRDANRWPAEKFQRLARRLLALPGVRVALVGGPIAGPLCDEITRGLEGRVWRADGRLSLLASAALFERADVVVTGDTGPMHIAVAVQTPVVALLGPTNPLRTGPYASDATVLYRRLRCSPCTAKRCPLNLDPPPCMNDISVDEVFAAVERRLGDDRRRKSA